MWVNLGLKYNSCKMILVINWANECLNIDDTLKEKKKHYFDTTGILLKIIEK